VANVARSCCSQDVFKRAAEKEIKIDVTERFKDRLVDEVRFCFDN
jgi:hypothetical protein